MFPLFPMIELDITQFFELAVKYDRRGAVVDRNFKDALNTGADLFVQRFQTNMHRDTGKMADTTKKVPKGPLYYAIETQADYWKWENARDGNKQEGNPPLGTPHEFVKRTNNEVRPLVRNIMNIKIIDAFRNTR
jgi:hypothetical protein